MVLSAFVSSNVASPAVVFVLTWNSSVFGHEFSYFRSPFCFLYTAQKAFTFSRVVVSKFVLFVSNGDCSLRTGFFEDKKELYSSNVDETNSPFPQSFSDSFGQMMQNQEFNQIQ